ncbi:KIR protein [Plasmodium coatneyi]|uniref:KIR protein n=1 Tax=Plasmodium coatneyi TaxID=208452 RepID=A0A1B1DSK9_9APIC|nr:KIR protein [Plasmodium coatneyi]ANQ05771.1 KIR protein [Plasmodium coatneyi]
MAPGSASTRPLTKADLRNLPSRLAYDNFNNNWNTWCKDTYVGKIRNSVKTTLQKHPNTDKCLDKVLGAWYYVNKVMFSGSPYHKDRCEYFYYWLGDLISDKLVTGSSFSTFLSDVYNALEKLGVDHKCKKIDEFIAKSTFTQMRKMYEYYRDYQTIQEQLQRSGNKCDKDYDQHLKDILKAYNGAQSKCTAVGATYSKWCSGFEDMFTEQKYKNLLDQKRTVDEDYHCLDQLPSESAYSALNNVKEHCNNGSVLEKEATKTSMKHSLNSYQGTPDYADIIIDGWCYANGEGKSKLPTDDLCDFLYYWTGDLLPGTPKSVQLFAGIMSAIYGNLGEFKIDGKCTDMYDKISTDIFNKMKTVFDYSKDYGTIKKFVQYTQAGGPSCTDVYYLYLDRVATAYQYMKTHCPDGIGSNEQWCKNFKSIAEERTYNQLLQLKCSLKHTSDCPRNATVAGAISGALASVGLPTIVAFFLHKYNLLPSWFGKHFKGGRKNIRGRERRSNPRNVDMFTDDSSTETSTYVSTVDSSSNLTENSSIYNGERRRPPTGRNNNDGRRQQQQTAGGGQRGQSHRNIGYGRM